MYKTDLALNDNGRYAIKLNQTKDEKETNKIYLFYTLLFVGYKVRYNFNENVLIYAFVLAFPYDNFRGAGSKSYLANSRSTMKSKIILKYKSNNEQFLNLLCGHESINMFDPQI